MCQVHNLTGVSLNTSLSCLRSHPLDRPTLCVPLGVSESNYVGRTPPQLQMLPPPRHPPPQTLQDHSCSITSLHHPEGTLPTITTHGSTILLLKLSNSLSLFIQQAEIRANAGGTCKWWQFTGLNKESVGYPAALLTLPPCAQQKAPHVSLAWPFSMVLNCSYAGYSAIQDVAPSRSSHILGPCSPAIEGVPQLSSVSLIKQLVSTVGPVPKDRHMYVFLHTCTSSSLDLQCMCLLSGPWGVLSVHTNVLQSPRDYPYKSLIRNPTGLLCESTA